MYQIEWLGKGETGKGWLKVLAEKDITAFLVETLQAGGIILSITKAD